VLSGQVAERYKRRLEFQEGGINVAKYSEDHKRDARGDPQTRRGAIPPRRDRGGGCTPADGRRRPHHGGFYSHFGSRAELVAETLEYASASTHAYFEKAVADCPDDKKLETIVRRYLRPIHR
jgi:TetR/AcrR family transcriptional repressor of nem operon